MSCVRRSNVQTVLSGEQLIDQVQFVLLWLLCGLEHQNKPLWGKKTSYKVVTLQQVSERMHMNSE